MEAEVASGNTSARGKDLFGDAIVWDNHACMPVRPGDVEYLDDLERHRQSGASFVSLNVSFDRFPWHFGFKMLATFRSWIKRHSERYLLVDKVSDIHRAKREGKLGVAFDLEGAVAVDDLPELVEPYYALGVKWMLIAYNLNNRLGGGCQDDDPGLTEFGRRVIDEMERVGMVLCCSHTGYRTAREAIEYSSNPVIFSHSAARALTDHHRNVPDPILRRLPENGGVVMIVFYPPFVEQGGPATLSDVADHIEHVRDLIGADHVGLGSDFDGIPVVAEGLEDVSTFPALIAELSRRGWTEAELRKAAGENVLRVMREVEAVARRLQR